MSHTFLSIRTDLIDKDLIDLDNERTSNDNSRLLIDGYNDKRELVHSGNNWKGSLTAGSEIISTAIEYTATEFKAKVSSPESIWFVEGEL